MVFQAIQQIERTGRLKLFKSHREGFADGEQRRDFVFVDDVCRVVSGMIEQQPPSGIYNVGTGVARTFSDLAQSVFDALGTEMAVDFVDMPESIRSKYQYLQYFEVQQSQIFVI